MLSRKTVEVLEVPLDTFTVPQVLEYIGDLARDGRSHYIVTPNPEFIMQSLGDSEFKEIIKRADLSLPDGVGVLWAAKYLSLALSKNKALARIQSWWQLVYTGIQIVLTPKALTTVIPERVTGADMVWEISNMAASQNWPIFLVGAAPGVAGETAEKLKLLNPRLEVLGATSGPPEENIEDVVTKIRELKPKFVFLAFPAKEQLRWMEKYSFCLPGTTLIGIGGALDFIVGSSARNAPEGNKSKARRAPNWMQDRGLEWLWRLITQPWRRERILNATVRFVNVVRKHRLVQ
ncbi:MAG: WecB/TagA/CpsF family glycosyltransferase [Patescibacteria group bacterium]|nr:WecB/TagA/CpsF family glycosyltransferase [Patescibacteria group bacterium]